MISLRWHRKTVTQRRNARAKWLPVPRVAEPFGNEIPLRRTR
jgi:hypothetical protein